MARRISSSEYQGTTGGGGVDGYFDRVIKYIPSDVVGAWVAATGIIQSNAVDKDQSARVLWIAFAFGTIFTALWMWRQTSAPGKSPAVAQITIATGSFIVWVFALGGPFATLSWFQTYMGSLVLIGYTLLTGLLVPKDSKEP
jgi:hypothetical protein